MAKAQLKRREELQREREEDIEKIRSGRKTSFSINDVQLEIEQTYI
jgi:hypothetical protein